MDDPAEEITSVIKQLCTADSTTQQQTIDTYFTQDAQFIHPFCRTIPGPSSGWMIKKIYAWYKILSPHIDIDIEGVAFDQPNLTLYVSIHQIFRIQFIPFYRAPVSLVTKLQLTHNAHGPEENNGLDASYSGVVKRSPGATASAAQKYYIKSQEDLYQTNEFVKFVLPWGIGETVVWLWQVVATLACVLGAMVFWPLTWVREEGFAKKRR